VLIDSGGVVGDDLPHQVPAERLGDRPPPARAARARVPADPGLPALGTLLDPSAMSAILGRSLGDAAPPPDVRLRYLRYRPGATLIVHYEVGTGGGWQHATAMIRRGSSLAGQARRPEHLALARKLRRRSPASRPLAHEPDLGALVQWLPLDLRLPALAAPPAELLRRLSAAGVSVPRDAGEPALLGYKPRRRAVTRLGEHVLKFYASGREFAAAAAALRAASELDSPVTPRFKGALPRLRLTVQSWIAGTPMVAFAGDTPSRAGAALRALHESAPRGLEPFSPARQLEEAGASARLVCALAPQLRRRLERLLAELERALPAAAPVVTAHGDFNPRHLLQTDGDLALTDFDGLSAAPAALDLATYAAQRVRGDPNDLSGALSTLEELLHGYGERPPALAWYLSTMVLRRSPRPFRSLDERWPERLALMVDAAEEAWRP
jgi:hypothetical protein